MNFLPVHSGVRSDGSPSMPPADRQTPGQAAQVAADDALISGIRATDGVVPGVPRYNVGVSTQCRNRLDAIACAQVTFRGTAGGPEALQNALALVHAQIDEPVAA